MRALLALPSNKARLAEKTFASSESSGASMTKYDLFNQPRSIRSLLFSLIKMEHAPRPTRSKNIGTKSAPKRWWNRHCQKGSPEMVQRALIVEDEPLIAIDQKDGLSTRQLCGCWKNSANLRGRLSKIDIHFGIRTKTMNSGTNFAGNFLSSLRILTSRISMACSDQYWRPSRGALTTKWRA